MRLALFVPCLVDQLFPDVAQCSLELLERLGHEVWVPDAVGCCGQPLINLGACASAQPMAEQLDAVLAECDALVCPSGSCVATLHQHPKRYGLNSERWAGRVFELTEFLLEHLDVGTLGVTFPHRVALHPSCHGLRELRHGPMSELMLSPAEQPLAPAERLLSQIKELTLVTPRRPDECCGFGGSFSVGEPEVSAKMGCDRLDDFEQAGAEVITSSDVSCLMHLSGLIRRQQRSLTVLHVAQILAGRSALATMGGADQEV